MCNTRKYYIIINFRLFNVRIMRIIITYNIQFNLFIAKKRLFVFLILMTSYLSHNECYDWNF